VLLSQTETNDESQSEALEQLTAEIQVVDTELVTIRQEKLKSEEEFQCVYSEIDRMFNSLKCEWADAPDAHTTVTPANAMFCLARIEVKIADMISNVYEKTKVECLTRDIKPSSFLSDDQKPQDSATLSKHSIATKPVQEKELLGKVADASKPFSLEEMRLMLEA
jgi:hypothetical protein